MIGWLIFGGIVLIVVFLLFISVSLRFVYENDIDFKITYFIFTLYPIKKKKKRKKRKVKSKKEKRKANITAVKKNKSSESGNDPEKKLIKQAILDKHDSDKHGNRKTSAEKIDIIMIRTLIESFAHPFGRLLKKVRFNDIYINSKVRSRDAAAVAVNYGLQCAAVSSLLAYIDSAAKVNVKEININPDFNSYTDGSGYEENAETELFIRCKIKIRLASLILFAAVSIWRYVKNNMKNEDALKTARKIRK